jgi:uncharacterized phage infection (PIP) family protein YhgE
VKAAFLEYSHQLAWLEPFLPEALLFLLALLTIVYVMTLRRIRFDLRTFSKALQDGLSMNNGIPVLPRFRSRDVRKISQQMNGILKRQTHRAHWMLEFLVSAEARLNAQAEANNTLSKTAREQKDHLETLQEVLAPYAESLEKLPSELTASMSGGQLHETGRMLDTVIESMESALERMVATAQAVKTFETSAGEFENIVPLLNEMAYETQYLSYNAQLAVSQSPGSAAERAVVSGSDTLEKKAKSVAADLVAEAGRVRERTLHALSTHRSGNIRLLESSQFLEEARREIRDFAAFLHSSAQKVGDDLNDNRKRLEKVFSVLETLTLAAGNTIVATGREKSICEEALYAVRKMQGNLRSAEISTLIAEELATSGVGPGSPSPENDLLPGAPERQDEED